MYKLHLQIIVKFKYFFLFIYLHLTNILEFHIYSDSDIIYISIIYCGLKKGKLPEDQRP